MTVTITFTGNLTQKQLDSEEFARWFAQGQSLFQLNGEVKTD